MQRGGYFFALKLPLSFASSRLDYFTSFPTTAKAGSCSEVWDKLRDVYLLNGKCRLCCLH